MKAADVRAKTDDELTGELEILGKEIFNLRFQRANGQLENTSRVRQVRRNIARIKTVLGERGRNGGLAFIGKSRGKADNLAWGSRRIQINGKSDRPNRFGKPGRRHGRGHPACSVTSGKRPFAGFLVGLSSGRS